MDKFPEFQIDPMARVHVIACGKADRPNLGIKQIDQFLNERLARGEMNKIPIQN